MGENHISIFMCGRQASKNFAIKYERLLTSNKNLLAENKKLKEKLQKAEKDRDTFCNLYNEQLEKNIALLRKYDPKKLDY